MTPKKLCVVGWCVALSGAGVSTSVAAGLECSNWQSAHPEWLWCDDFEADQNLETIYFEVDRAQGRFGVTKEAAFGGTGSLRGRFVPGESNAGNLKLAVGRNPITQLTRSQRDLQEVYWRFYASTSAAWSGNAQKMTRATIFTASNWTQAAIGHLWQDSQNANSVGLDPASGVVGGTVVTTKYNDFDHLQWLGARNATTPIYSAANRQKWFCIEVRMKLNTSGQSDGLFAVSIDGRKEAEITGLNWRGSYTGYGINAVMLENWDNDSVTATQDRYFDNLVVSTSPIGCLGPVPNAPTDVRTQ